MKTLNEKFDTIETIRTNSEITNKSQAYIIACDMFEAQATNLLKSETKSFFMKKFIEEVSLSYAKAKTGDCEYSIYASAHACEVWLSKAYKSSQVN